MARDVDSADDIWVIGNNGTVIHRTPTDPPSPAAGLTTANLSGVWGSGRSDVWIVGNGGKIFHLTPGP